MERKPQLLVQASACPRFISGRRHNAVVCHGGCRRRRFDVGNHVRRFRCTDSSDRERSRRDRFACRGTLLRLRLSLSSPSPSSSLLVASRPSPLPLVVTRVEDAEAAAHLSRGGLGGLPGDPRPVGPDGPNGAPLYCTY